MMKSLVILVAFFVAASQAFVVAPRQNRLISSSLSMSDEPMLGDTERMLLETKERKESGIIQKYGQTVKNDGLDGVRAFVWGIFDVTNAIFPVLGVALTMGLFLNMAGYGYFFDTNHGLVVDTLQHIQQEQALQAEAARMATDAVNKAGMF
ncbi:expressed unknown protein [Seminavis robusta]|uniref:Uncharacterized protein n=1 Tax=Seminavis robusta TaxID=568900 RepID=A0A9N8HCB3_9STRA|nr:expressed unknown protein [Seminavis robusta]|eukprot:Sro400_g135230.1 n/a (151) ;mRNA; f:68232-68684